MFKYQQLIKEHLEDIAKLITVEQVGSGGSGPLTATQGKTLPDAQGDVMRGLQVVEQACSVTNLMMGENLQGVSKDMDLSCFRCGPALSPQDAPRRLRRHRALQLPSHDPAVDVPHGAHLRQHVHHEAQREGPHRLHGPRRAPQGGRSV